ncbi:MAG: replication initiator protein A [Pseudomonadota bacterium]
MAAKRATPTSAAPKSVAPKSTGPTTKKAARMSAVPMARSEFAKLSLHEKNHYLQGLAQDLLAERGEEFIPLTKEALSRLRRFYSRRSFADLRLGQIDDPDLRDRLQTLGERIHGKDLRQSLESELPASRNNRPRPLDDDQLMFFVPTVADAPIKDEMNLMDIAPFALGKMKREGSIRYELKDSVISIEGGAEVGLATAYDYDIFLNMVSHLAEEMRRYRIAEKKGQRPSLPSLTYRPSAAQILKFCRRGTGGKQYVELERALDRLQATRIKITNLSGGKRRETQSFPLIGRYKVVSRTTQDRIETVEIDVPSWVYDGVVKPDGAPSILTLNPDYFLIAKPIARFIYRLARKAAGQGEAFYTMADLHYRSGTKLPIAKFQKAVETIVSNAELDPIPDYDLTLIRGHDDAVLRMKRREPQALSAENRGGNGNGNGNGSGSGNAPPQKQLI